VIRCEMDCNTEVPLAFCGAMHNRMKEAAVLLGRQKRAVVRPPLMKLDDAELRRIADALKAAGNSERGADGLDLAAVGGMAAGADRFEVRSVQALSPSSCS